MATNTATSLPSMTSDHLSYTVPEVVMSSDHLQEPQADADDGSSSLSELGERVGHDEADIASRDDSEANDTEAETERLEDSPHKQRKYQNVVLTSTNGIYNDRESAPAVRTISGETGDNGHLSDGDRFGQTSDISSLADSGEEIGKALSTSPFSPRKRKRSSFEEDSLSDHEPLEDPSTRLFSNTAATLVENASLDASGDEDDQEAIIDTEALPNSNIQSRKAQQYVPTKQKYQKGKRKGKKTRDDRTEDTGDSVTGAELRSEQREGHAAGYSNGEDMEVDDTGDVPEADNLVKTEEGVMQKRTALDSLNAMEKCFAKIRDKLFDEQLGKCNEELAMLEQHTPIHPELVAMKEVIDQRRDQKIEVEYTWLKYRLQTLQRESVANKPQAHSQFMQTAREIRASNLDQLNKGFYQLQRERRSCEDDVPDYMYNFTTRRSQQITEQTAYNAEVSILSGVAKHVGFPAAPDISKARPQEIEDDLRIMGVSGQRKLLTTQETSADIDASQIAPEALRTFQNQPLALKTSLSATAGFHRQRPAAEEHFLEQTPWANPQHPSHHHQRQQMHRQVSALSRAATPSTTPASQRRVIDLTEPQGSASTIAEPQSGPNSSMAPTPATGEAARLVQSDLHRAVGDNFVDSTPSRTMGGPSEAPPVSQSLPEATTDKGKAPQVSKSPSLSRQISQDAHTPSAAIAKPLPFMHTGGSSSTPGIRASTPVRYPVIKSEDASQLSRRSPLPHQYHQPAPVSTVGNGQNRFAA